MIKLLRILQIKPNEKVTVFWSFALAFLIGSAQCYLCAVPMSLFLTHYSSASLPQVYLIVAGLAILLGSIYSYFEQRLTFNRLMLGLILVIGITTTFLWFILIGLSHPLIIALLTVWAIVAYDLLDLGIWSVFSRIYNLQQGKRLFGIIASTQSMGGIASGLMLPALLMFLSTEHVVLLIGFMIFAALSILIGLLRSQVGLVEEEETDSSEKVAEKRSITILFRSKYIIKLMCLVALGVFAMYIVDIVFNTVAEERYPDETALAGFFGVFFGLVYVVNLVISSLVFSRLLARIGVISSLLILPVIAIIISASILISGVAPLFVVLIFWLIALLKLFEEAMRASLSDMCNLLLLQPLSPGLRNFVLSKNDTLIVPLATATISIILIGMTQTVGIVIPWLVFATLICFGIYTLITLTLKSDYIKELSKAIANRYTMSSTFQKANKESLPFFRKALHSKYSDEIVYALSTIEQIDTNEFLRGLDEVFKSRDEAVLDYVLDKIRQYRVTPLYPNIVSLLESTANEKLKPKLIHTIADLDYNKSSPIMKDLVNNDNPLVHNAVLIELWKHGDDLTKNEVIKKVNQMCLSNQETDLESAAFIIGEVNDSMTNKLLDNLLLAPSKSVKQEALKAVIKTSHIEYFNALLEHFSLLHLSGDLLHRFIALSNKIMPIIQDNFLSYSTKAQLKLLYIMGEMNTTMAQSFLEHAVLAHNGSIQQSALRSLARSKGENPQVFLEKLYQQINEEVRYLSEQHAFLQMIPIFEITQLLRDVLKRKIILSIERLMLAISIYYHDKPVAKVKTGLEIGNSDEVSYALELLERIVDKEQKRVMLPVLSSIYLSESEINAGLDSVDFQKLLKIQLNIFDHEPLTILSCLASLYIIKTIGEAPFISELEELKHSKSAIIQETLDWLNSPSQYPLPS